MWGVWRERSKKRAGRVHGTKQQNVTMKSVHVGARVRYVLLLDRLLLPPCTPPFLISPLRGV